MHTFVCGVRGIREGGRWVLGWGVCAAFDLPQKWDLFYFILCIQAAKWERIHEGLCLCLLLADITSLLEVPGVSHIWKVAILDVCVSNKLA